MAFRLLAEAGLHGSQGARSDPMPPLTVRTQERINECGREQADVGGTPLQWKETTEPRLRRRRQRHQLAEEAEGKRLKDRARNIVAKVIISIRAAKQQRLLRD